MDDLSIIFRTDSYKVTNHRMYPPDTETVRSYLESRGGVFDHTLFFGLQPILEKYLEGQQVYLADIDDAAELYAEHFGDDTLFNKSGWEHIYHDHDGKLPIEIRAVEEGSIVPVSNVLMTVENTCHQCYWLTNYVESVLLKVWYPTTVATLSNEIRTLILSYLEKTGDPSLIDFKLHDFGYRGASSEEAARIGGCAHLVNFQGTDTIPALLFAKYYYDAKKIAGYSVPAAEHSTVITWGEENEAVAYENMLTKYAKGLVSVVSDSYDIKNAIKIWGITLKEKILAREGVLVIRPDSGDPIRNLNHIMHALIEYFGSTKNSKGFEVLHPKVRIIQGDGVDYRAIHNILGHFLAHGWSADNITFGMGGALLQRVDRDTQKFAFKASQIIRKGVKFDVSKRSEDKASKAGHLSLVFRDGQYKTVRRETIPDVKEDLLLPVFKDGIVLRRITFEQIRKIARRGT